MAVIVACINVCAQFMYVSRPCKQTAALFITLPPLRERKEDIPLLIAFFLNKMSACIKVSVADEAMKHLLNYNWPGNVRELENVVEQIVILRCSNIIQLEDLPPHISKVDTFKGSIIRLPEEGYSLEDLEREAIAQALSLCKGNKTQAAKLLRVSRHALNYRIEKHNLSLQGEKK